MISLPHNCSCSDLTVNPKNWKTCKASALSKPWYIQYYFYDAVLDKKEFIVIKGMNRLGTLEERREATRQLIENELYQLRERGYNPITGKYIPVESKMIEPTTPFVLALEKAYEVLKLEATTRNDIASTIKYFSIASKKLILDKMEIQSIKRKHLMQMLDLFPSLKKSWSAYSYNNSRAYLMMLFKRLLLLEAIESNPVNEIPKEQVPVKLKQVLTREQRKQISEYLLKVDPDYQQIIQIFFHSGSRALSFAG